jgi:hypothetical protein
MLADFRNNKKIMVPTSDFLARSNRTKGRETRGARRGPPARVKELRRDWCSA